MQHAELLILLLICMTGFGLLAKRLLIPEPIMMVLGGLGVSLIPGLPNIELKPDYLFLLVLPPLLYAQAWTTSWQDFCLNLRSITLLAVGLVLFTTLAVGFIFHLLLPGLPIQVGFILGAIISPPDAIAAAEIAQKLRLPKRMVAILEGESLVNDATGLVAFKFALASLATGSFSVGSAGLQLIVVAGGGILVGLGVALIFAWGLRVVKDDLLDIVLSLIAPFASYILAEHLHVSGVLSTVTCGLWLGTRSSQLLSSSTRLTGAAFWNMLVFMLNGLVFMLIGLQLPKVLKEISNYGHAELAWFSAVTCGVVVLTRIIWVFPGAYVPRLLSEKIRATEPRPHWQNVAVVSWCGMRGVVSLAAALALPYQLPDGTLMPGRGLVIFLTFVVILFTLIVQGLSLPWVIRSLKIHRDKVDESAEQQARKISAEAALRRLRKLPVNTEPEREALERASSRYDERLAILADPVAGAFGWSPQLERSLATLRFRREALHAEREALIDLHRKDLLEKELLMKLERELDLEEARLG